MGESTVIGISFFVAPAPPISPASAVHETHDDRRVARKPRSFSPGHLAQVIWPGLPHRR